MRGCDLQNSGTSRSAQREQGWEGSFRLSRDSRNDVKRVRCPHEAFDELRLTKRKPSWRPWSSSATISSGQTSFRPSLPFHIGHMARFGGAARPQRHAVPGRHAWRRPRALLSNVVPPCSGELRPAAWPYARIDSDPGTDAWWNILSVSEEIPSDWQGILCSLWRAHVLARAHNSIAYVLPRFSRRNQRWVNQTL